MSTIKIIPCANQFNMIPKNILVKAMIILIGKKSFVVTIDELISLFTPFLKNLARILTLFPNVLVLAWDKLVVLINKKDPTKDIPILQKWKSIFCMELVAKWMKRSIITRLDLVLLMRLLMMISLHMINNIISLNIIMILISSNPNP